MKSKTEKELEREILKEIIDIKTIKGIKKGLPKVKGVEWDLFEPLLKQAISLTRKKAKEEFNKKVEEYLEQDIPTSAKVHIEILKDKIFNSEKEEKNQNENNQG